ncbi:MAG: carboxypeptidase-like regulatory domain-containing protein [Proteobacteria bacterium]|nr:carboxypeptidase-like regulatory domain-containing protein [Pseudomonadota bacterium]MBU1714271.1 carboxypeptidase-like regulatory domain-containing protein [Pseudomonadota bacterium]
MRSMSMELFIPAWRLSWNWRRVVRLGLLSVFLCLMVLPSTLLADEMGSITVLVFEGGKPLAGAEVMAKGGISARTDGDGGVKLEMAAGSHQLLIIGRDPFGRNLGYFRRQVEVRKGKDTMVLATFRSDNDDLIEIDTPLEGKKEQKIKSFGTGTLQGAVLDAETGLPIDNARIFIKGSAIEGRTDENGLYRIEVPSGVVFTVSIIHPEYSGRTVDILEVAQGQEFSREVLLSPAGVELEEFVVLAPKVQGSITSIVREERTTVSIANILGSEEMGKKGDSSAAGALKRVTGVTLVDGDNVYVRGLGDRYSNIEMNSMPLPSPNPLKRVVPLDIFPAGAISLMKVQKSATADIPSSFGGGYIDIHTKDSSRENFLKVSLGVGGNSNTGEKVFSYKGSDSDVSGFDDGYREISPNILNNSSVVVGERITGLTTDNFSKAELSQFTREYVERSYEVEKEKQPIGFDLGIEGAENFSWAEKHEVALFGFYTYETDSTSKMETYNKYDMEKATGRLYPDPSQWGLIDTAATEYIHNGMLNIGYNYTDILRMKYTKLFTHNGEKTTIVADGIMGSNNEDMTKYYLNWEERTMNVDQFNGTFDYELYGNETNFRFGLEKASSELYQPNNYHYTFRNEGAPFLDNKVSNNIANRLESDDNLLAFYLKNKFHFDLFSPEDFIDVGLAVSSKERESRQSKFFLKKQGAGSIVDDHEMTGTIEEIYNTFVRPDIPYDERSLVVGQLFKPADYYDAEVDETAFYLNSFCKPEEDVEVLFGARFVDFSQVVYQYVEDRNNPDMSKRRLIARVPEELTVSEVYPSLGVKYSYNPKNIFDLALSQTYIAPDLREFTSGEYFHPYEVATIIGNPDLVNTDIFSFDLKYGHYFSDIQYIKLGLFYKYLDKPIEDVMVPSSSLPIYSFDNADKATMYGLEIDGRKNLSFISEWLENYYLAGNLSFIESEVTLRKEQESIYSTNNRELQGLSPIVVNLTLGFDRRDRSITLSYNKMGERIRKVGMIDDGDSYPDQYEAPPAILDFVWIEKFGHGLSLKGKIGNILRDDTVWTQGNRVTTSYKDPIKFSLEISFSAGL